MRFVPPERAAVTEDLIDQPVFAGLAPYRDLLLGPAWPSLAELNAVVRPLHHRTTGHALALSAQESLADGENYEQRIFHRGLIATRSGNWHDLLNALAWLRFPATKSALNAGQVEDMARVGMRQRTRRQCAFTQFDEAGAIVVLRDADLLALWDAHDWAGLFLAERRAWSEGRISLAVFGHALFEHALNPEMLLVSKTLVLIDDRDGIDDASLDRQVATAIAAGACLGDPQELRPLPMSGIPGWHREPQDVDFYRDKPCFRSLRPGRRYPAPLSAGRPVAPGQLR